ncbi:Pc20g10070 [Penicillium rubens Wisconsin 54-1255]|uniref:Pc20g10070 protein n=1 Tax=Penicillium rubens (strain ATCC 28089 / DSM 1075 / NRRL 1951 / Wisconsin 54-1255) TaxID=500485 RepID=B6HFK8_PENRW|nr:Pc20g10070 [Penicillium rubens Wisconsin 54-1255]
MIYTMYIHIPDANKNWPDAPDNPVVIPTCHVFFSFSPTKIMAEKIAVDANYYTLTQDWEPEDFQSETTSISSSIAKGRLENGRRSPSDEQQFEAFEIGLSVIFSHMMFMVLDHERENPLHHAPIGKSPQHILDIGTGKGTWAIYPCSYYVTLTSSATVRGVDIFPPPVTWMPPNCLFEVDDILREWTWREPFDFIHMRLMLGSFTPEGWDQLYKQCYDALTPGGWIEQVELDVRVYSDDGSLKQDSTLATWGDNFIGCSERAGRSLLTQETMRGAMEKAGFVDVQEKLYKIPLGPWPKDKVLKEVGQLQYAHWLAALEGWAMWLLTKFGAPSPWSKEEVQLYLSNVRAELRNPRTHAYELCRRVWARKPTVEEEMADLAIKTEPEV